MRAGQVQLPCTLSVDILWNTMLKLITMNTITIAHAHTHTHTHMGVPIIKQKQMYGSKYTFLVTSVRATWCHQDTPAHSHTKEKGHYSKRRKLNLWPQLLVCYLSHNHPHTHIVSLLTPTHTLSHPFEMQYIHDTISYWTASFKRHWDIPCPTNLHVTYSTAHPPTHSSPNI